MGYWNVGGGLVGKYSLNTGYSMDESMQDMTFSFGGSFISDFQSSHLPPSPKLEKI